jgi:predicted MarR family transcription regulator
MPAARDRKHDSAARARRPRSGATAARSRALGVEARTLLELELASVRASAAFATWIAEIHSRSGGPPLSGREIVLLHCLRAREGAQTLAELRRFVNVRDVPRLHASLARLCAAGLVRSGRGGGVRESSYGLTASGRRLATRCDSMRDVVLVSLCRRERGLLDGMRAARDVLERLVTLYGQATQYVSDQEVLVGVNPYTRGPLEDVV